MSDSLWPHELKHAGPPYPSPTPGVHSNSCPLSRWCHPNISSSVDLFSSCPLPQHESFPMRWLFTSGGQSIGASASTSVLPMNIQGWFSLGLTGLISLLSKGLSGVFSNTIVWRHLWHRHSNYLLEDFLSSVSPLPGHPTNHCYSNISKVHSDSLPP